MDETIAREIEAQARRQESLSLMLQNLSPRSGLFTVTSEDLDGVDPELREDGYGSRRIGCWIFLRMLKAVERKSPEDARWVLAKIADEVREKWAKEIAAHSQFRLVRLAEIPPKPVEWVLEPLWPRGELVIVDGDPDAARAGFGWRSRQGSPGRRCARCPSAQSDRHISRATSHHRG